MNKSINTINLAALLFVTGMFLLSSCSRKTQQSMQNYEDQPGQISGIELSRNANQFAFDLLPYIAIGSENTVFSPFSIRSALAMTYAGAREATMDEMAATLHFSRNQLAFHQAFGEYLQTLRELAGDSVQLNIANSLWAQQNYHFLESYFDFIETHYGSLLFPVDFVGQREPVRQQINHWVEEQTRDMIRDLIAPGVLTEDTRLVLVNAIHFYGPWKTAFDKNMSFEDVFYALGGERNRTKFMFRGDNFNYYEDERAQVLSLPYSGGNFEMTLVLPSEATDIKSFEKELTTAWFTEATESMNRTRVEAFIPRFKAESKMELDVILKEMGMPLAFSEKADFSAMTGKKDLAIDKVIHQAAIEVEEEGTEAAAATAVVVIRKTSIDPMEDLPVVFRANRPFLFFIRDTRYNSILFMGRVINP